MNRILSMGLCVLMMMFALSACGGGGGGGGGGGNETPIYDYKAAMFGADENNSFSQFLGLNVPGSAFANSTSGTVSYYTIQSPLGPGDSGSVSLTVDEFGFANLTDPPDDPMFGAATPDGSVFFSTETTKEPVVDEWVNILVGINRTSGMSTSVVDGLYKCATVENNGVSNSVSFFQLDMDGSTGTFTGGPGGVGSYTVSGDGSMTVTAGGGSIKGAARNGGDVFIISFNDIGDMGFVLCVLDPGSHTIEELQGNYRVAKFQVPASGSPSGALAEAFLDGTGYGSIANVADASGFVSADSRELLLEVGYIVNGSDFYETGDGNPIYMTSAGDLIFIVDSSDGGDGSLMIGTKYVPLGFPSDYLAVSVSGDAIANLVGTTYSINGMGNSIAPDESGTLGIRSIIDSSGMYTSMTDSFMVNSAGFINVPGSGKPTWGFINTTAKTFILATTDQTSDDYVSLIPGVMAGSGLSNTIAASSIYNCSAIADAGYPDIELEFTGNGELTVYGTPMFYGLTDYGLLTLHDSGVQGIGAVHPDEQMIVLMADGLIICLDEQADHANLDEITGTFVYGTFNINSGADPQLSAELGTVDITNSTDTLGEVTPTVLYNSTGAISSPSADTPIPMVLNTTAQIFEIGGLGGYPVWVNSDLNMFVFADDSGDGMIVFGIRKE